MILKYPYLSVILKKKSDEKIVCLIQSVSKQHISFYEVDKLKAMDVDAFIRLADNWWVKENTIPISLYYKDIFNRFDYIKTFLDNSEYEIIQGFEGIKLKSLSDKRIKRKLIHIDEPYNAKDLHI